MERLRLWLLLLVSCLICCVFIVGVVRSPPVDYLMWAYCFGIAIWTILIVRSLLSLTFGAVSSDAVAFALPFAGLWVFAIVFLIAMYSYQFRYFGIIDTSGLDPTSIMRAGQKITQNPWTCFYFAIVTWTTVGFGDFVPANEISRAFAAVEALTGYVIMGVFIAALINLLRPTNRVDLDKINDLLARLDEQNKALEAIRPKH